jgi:hypothetical protein
MLATSIKEGKWVSYRGELDIYLNDVEYAIRRFATDPDVYCEGVWESDILPTVGTIRRTSSWKGFPPTEIIQWAKEKYGSHYVGAMYNAKTKRFEYTEPQPKLAQCSLGYWRPEVDINP